MAAKGGRLSKETVHRNALTPGHRLHWYVIEGVLGQGGFGITYLADDTNLDRKVAIKEFLPVELAVRTENGSVMAASSNREQGYGWGLERFISEARTLAKFNHRAIVRVHSVFEANNTAYMVMDYEEGETLKSLLMREKTLGEAQLRHILAPILDGLEWVHQSGFIHRDIKPSNVFIRRDGSAVLMDFGSARQALGPRTTTLTNMVSPGYAPFEQYMTDGERQGPWTDIYGAGATLYRAVTARSPLDAIRRSEGILREGRDAIVLAVEAASGRYSRAFLMAIDHALAFNVEQRPDSIEQWRAEFGLKPMAVADTPDMFLQVQAARPALGLGSSRRDGAGAGSETVLNTRHTDVAVADDMLDSAISARYTGTAGPTQHAPPEPHTRPAADAHWPAWRPAFAIAALVLGVLGVAKWPDRQAPEPSAALGDNSASPDRALNTVNAISDDVSKSVFGNVTKPSPEGALVKTASLAPSSLPWAAFAPSGPGAGSLPDLTPPIPAPFIPGLNEPATGSLLALTGGYRDGLPAATPLTPGQEVSAPPSRAAAPPPTREARDRRLSRAVTPPNKSPQQEPRIAKAEKAESKPASLARFQQQRLGRLFARAQQAEREGRYTSPRWDNAASFYREILSVDSGNARARAGLRRAESVASAPVYRRARIAAWSAPQASTRPSGRDYRPPSAPVGSQQSPSNYNGDLVGDVITGTVQGVASGVRRFGRTLGRVFLPEPARGR